jgi:SAM-dependent methyltransferase
MADRTQTDKLYAQFHDLFIADFLDDVALYLDVAAKFGGPVLEAGCATGRLTLRLASAGHEVLGIDTARAQLEIARDRIRPYRQHARVIDHDLRHSAISERFRVFIATLHSFNALIDIEEQRRFLRHARQSMQESGVLLLDCFCPIALVRPETEGAWRELERQHAGRQLHVRDRRQMLTPLLERRTQVFQLDAGPAAEVITHRRYIPPQMVAQLLEEAGFDEIRWAQGYDLSSAMPIEEDARPSGPFLMLAET